MPSNRDSLFSIAMDGIMHFNACDFNIGQRKAENREPVVWLNGYMDPYEGEIDTAKYPRAEIVDKLLFD